MPIIDATSNIDINVIDQIISDDHQSLAEVAALFWQGVDDLKTLLADGAILFVPTSFGKDSTVTLLMALEAYRQMLAANAIETDRPLISATIDTRMEAIPMVMYQNYARKRLLTYAKEHGINLIHEMVQPSINDHFFVRFVSGSKLIGNASRSGDCSVILKIQPSEKFVKSVIEQYPHRQVVSVLGSRTAESGRRSKNMQKQNLKKSIEELRQELTAVTLGKVNLLNFAPIRDWSTDQVFDLLRIMGTKPLTKTNSHIPAFLSDGGLALEIYGNGSAETCSVAIGQTSGGSGCNGKARFGCTACTYVGAHDKTSTALASLERWRVLGVENTTRLRDYLFRLSTDMNARAFHARSYDPTTYSRVALQPNVLKPQSLEKVVRYAAQLTLESIKASEEFTKLVAAGQEMTHPGMQDIANDMTMHPKVKRAFLEMYREALLDARKLNYLFDREHAILLSFRWAIDGIGSAPFRPLAIYEELAQGQKDGSRKGWLPYPRLNSEIEATTGKKIKIITGDLPEAVMFRVFKEEDPKHFAVNPVDALSLWNRPADITDVFDEEHNCTIARHAEHSARVDITFTPAIAINDAKPESADFFFTDTQKFVRLATAQNQNISAKLASKTLSTESLSLLLSTGLETQISDHIERKLNHLLSKTPFEVTSAELNALVLAITTSTTITRSIRHLKSHQLFAGYQHVAKKAEPSINFTRRTASVKRGKIIKGNTRLAFYGLEPESRLHRAHGQYTELLLPDFETHTLKHIQYQQNEDAVTDNIHIDADGLKRWLMHNGLQQALSIHDAYFEAKAALRRSRLPMRLRTYGGTYPAEYLMEKGVLTIAPTYKEQLQFIVRRTQFFDSMGLFCFQSMPYEQVLMHPKAITMKQHRLDKAKFLAHIREKRNVERRTVVKTLKEQQDGNYTMLLRLVRENLSRIEQSARQSITFAGTGHTSSMFHLRFHTSDVSSSDMSKVHRLWLSMYLSSNEIDSYLLHAIGSTQLKVLKGHAPTYLESCSLVSAMCRRLVVEISNQLQTWSGVVQDLQNLRCASEHVTVAPIRSYREIILQSPYALSGYDNISWNPNLVNFQRQLSDKLNQVTDTFEQLIQSREKLMHLADCGRRAGAQRLSVSGKLTMLSTRAA